MNAPSSQTAAPSAWAWRAAAFLALFALLQLGWQAIQGGWLQWLIVHEVTVRPAAAVIGWLTPNFAVHAVKFSLVTPTGTLNIVNGCEGVEAVILLGVAILVSPVSWRGRGLGFLLGLVFVFAINQVRILTLFYSYHASRQLFSLLHGTVTPIGVIVAVCCYFYAWLNYFTTSRPVAGTA